MSAECGTRSGWSRHLKKGEKACPDCNEANTIYHRDYRRRNGTGRVYTFPTEISPGIASLDGLGLSIARALRESA